MAPGWCINEDKLGRAWSGIESSCLCLTVLRINELGDARSEKVKEEEEEE